MTFFRTKLGYLKFTYFTFRFVHTLVLIIRDYETSRMLKVIGDSQCERKRRDGIGLRPRQAPGHPRRLREREAPHEP